MMERYAEVGEDAVDLHGTIIAQEVGEIAEVAMYELKPLIASECRVGEGAVDGVAVLVERKQSS